MVANNTPLHNAARVLCQHWVKNDEVCISYMFESYKLVSDKTKMSTRQGNIACFVLRITGQSSCFHRQFINVRGTSY